MESEDLMPPMTSIKTFVAALRTGETRTTQALEKAVARRRGVRAEALIGLLRQQGACKTPLQDELRTALRAERLPERYIQNCIDGWPDTQKEQMRRAIVTAINGGHRVRFEWGITPAATYRTDIRRADNGTVTILALTPRSSLRASRDGDIAVMPPPRRQTRRS
jgi:hypothetical protein